MAMLLTDYKGGEPRALWACDPSVVAPELSENRIISGVVVSMGLTVPPSSAGALQDYSSEWPRQEPSAPLRVSHRNG